MFTKYVGHGFDNIQVGQRDSRGVFIGFDGLTAADTGESSSMRRLEGANTVNLGLPEPQTISVPGDNGVKAIFVYDSETLPSGVVELSVTDSAMINTAQRTVALSEAGQTFTPFGLSGAIPRRFITLFTRLLQGQDTGAIGAEGFEHFLGLNIEWRYLGKAFGNRATNFDRWQVTANYADRLPDGRLISAVFPEVPGAKCIGFEVSSEYRISYSMLVGDGTVDDIVVANEPISTAKTLATLETTDFATNAITAVDQSAPYSVAMTTAPASGKFGIVRYEFENFAS